MKITLFIFILISSRILSQIDDIKSTYIISQKSKTSTYVLHLKSNDKYEIISFLKNKDVVIPTTMLDSGKYTINKRFGIQTIKLESDRKIKFFLNKEKYFIYKDKLYSNILDPYLKYPYSAIKTQDTSYSKNIVFETKKTNPTITKDYTKSFFLANIKKYSPTYLSVIEESYCGPGCYLSVVNNKTVSWDNDTTYKTLINDYSTMVHETTHRYNGTGGYNWETRFWNIRVLIEPGITISFTQTPTFHSELFISIVPKEAPKKIFRYGTYVGRGSDPSANLSGIYGLMDEFSAYKNGTRASVEAANTAIKLNDKEKIEIFEQKAVGQYFAYYEFRLFIAWYLEYAQKNKPEIYKKIMANTNLRVSYTLLDDGFINDIKELEKLVKKYPIYSYEYNEKEWGQYVKTLLVDHEKTLIKFRIEGVTKLNYKDFLKKEEPIKKK
jgi:hypothetical protein